MKAEDTNVEYDCTQNSPEELISVRRAQRAAGNRAL